MTRSSPSSPSASADAIDELAAIFMTPADAAGGTNGRSLDAAGESATATDTFIELLLVGHLPVRGNLWLTPYADALAREIGPVALIRLDGEQPTLEVMRGRDEWRAQIAGRPMREALTCIAGEIRGWVIRPRAGTTGALPRPETIGAADRLMLLSGADQAAAVAAYQLLKRIKHEADEAEIDLPSIVMSVVGSQPESATAMVRRLQSTAMSQLSVCIELDRVLPCIDSEACSSMYLRFAGEEIEDAGEVAAMIDDALAATRRQRQPTIDEPMPDEPMAGRMSPAATANAQSTSAMREPFEASRAAANEQDDSPDEDAPAVAWDPIVRPSASDPEPAKAAAPDAARIKLSPKPAAGREAKPTFADRADGEGAAGDGELQPAQLAVHVSGLTPIDIRSPRSSHVELAVDASGGLHLLTRDAYLRELRIVEAWAHAHRELLTMALGDDVIDPNASITCHLFTSDPATVADLHGTAFKLHVLAPVEVEGRTGWYAAALNG